ncbi:hypothetical protein BRD07_04345 [Halobacteriales archaeon QS_9_68_42]|nr:MAG: hypothetical protein BRD07_04345 [Halobacteriales archaeon QS_9_68_42]
MLISTTAVLVEFANVLLITGTDRLLPALADNGWSVLAGALILGTTTVLGGAVKQRRSRYIAISASASAIALLVVLTRAGNPILPFLLLILGLYILMGGFSVIQQHLLPVPGDEGRQLKFVPGYQAPVSGSSAPIRAIDL